MNYNDLIFWAVLLVLAAIVIYLDKKYAMLRDNGSAQPRPYSFSRTQLTWWTVIILSSLITIMIRKDAQLPDLSPSILYLLGISSATSIGATLIDISDQSNTALTGLAQNMQSDNFFLDILSDKNGVNIHRFQTVVFNLIFGVWFIINFLANLNNTSVGISEILPVISSNNLILLGVSSGVYAALKSTENKQANNSANNIMPPAAGV